jgi:hypothetical protein
LIFECFLRTLVHMDASISVGHPSAAGATKEMDRRGRSAVSNGSRLHVKAPGDTAWARRFRDVFQLLLDDITPPDGRVSEGQRQLARRAATLSITCEQMEGEAAAGADIDFELYGRLSDRLGRTLTRLNGIKAVSAPINGPTLGNLIRADQAEERERRRAAKYQHEDAP